MCMQAWSHARIAISGNYTRQVLYINVEVWNKSHIIWGHSNPFFHTISSLTWYIFEKKKHTHTHTEILQENTKIH